MNESEKQHYLLDLSMFRHEVKNPMVSIGGFARRIVKINEDTMRSIEELKGLIGIVEHQEKFNSLCYLLEKGYYEVKDSSTRIVEESIRIEEVLDYIINEEELIHGLRPLRKERFDMSDLIKEVLKIPFIYTKIVDNEIDVDFHASMKKDEFVLNADRVLCRIIYENLIENSIRYIPNKGRLSFGAFEDNNYYIFNVYNSGPVISLEIIDNLENKNPKIGRINGRGYGLPLVCNIVALHGGKFKIEPNRFEGVNAIFTIPKK